MNKLLKVFLAIIGACSVLIDIMTPLVVALFWGYFFELNSSLDKLILIIGGLASLFRAIKIWWQK